MPSLASSPAFATLRQAVRRLRRAPGYTAITVLTLALGIGAVTAIFSVVYGVLLKPYGFEGKGQLVVWHETVAEWRATIPLAPANYRHFLNLQARSHTLQASALLQPGHQAVTLGNAHPQIVPSLDVTQDFFAVMQARPLLGRTLVPADFQNRGGSGSAVVLGWQAWQQFFARDPGAVGKTLRINGKPRIVVGVLSAGFHFPPVSLMAGAPATGTSPYGLFLPHTATENDLTDNTSDFDYFALGRLKPGIPVAAAQSELDGIEQATAYADHLPIHVGVVLEPFTQEVTGAVQKPLWLLLAAVAGVLLIGCVNLTNLQLARSIEQAGDRALRAALGASRTQLLGEVLAENLLLACAGGVAALFVAGGGLRLLVALAPAQLPRLGEARLSLPVLGLAALLSLTTSIGFGLLPAMRALQVDPMRVLGGAGTRTAGGSRGEGRARRFLLVAEIAFSLMLLCITGLVTRSFAHLLADARSFGNEPVTLAQADLSGPAYPDDTGSLHRNAVIDRIAARLQALPGVTAVGITSNLPLTGDMSVDSIDRPDHPLPPGQETLANLRMVSPSYFATLGIPIVSGREFAAGDRAHAHVAIVSASAAHAAWGAQNPVGHTLTRDENTYTVIGVTADARINDPRRDVSVLYLPYWEAPPRSPVFLVRGNAISGPEIRKAIWEVDPEAAIPALIPLRVQTAQALALERFQTLLLGGFGFTALLLAVLGVYGVLSYEINLRTREWGIRMALGSSRGRLFRLVLLGAGKPAIMGMVLGACGAMAAAKWLQSLLYGGHGLDASVLAAAMLLLACAVLLAALPSARRAASAEPAAILRGE